MSLSVIAWNFLIFKIIYVSCQGIPLFDFVTIFIVYYVLVEIFYHVAVFIFRLNGQQSVRLIFYVTQHLTRVQSAHHVIQLVVIYFTCGISLFIYESNVCYSVQKQSVPIDSITQTAHVESRFIHFIRNRTVDFRHRFKFLSRQIYTHQRISYLFILSYAQRTYIERICCSDFSCSQRTSDDTCRYQ